MCVLAHSINKALILGLIKELSDILEFDLTLGRLTVCNFLEHAHVLELAVNWVLLVSGNGRILESCDEIDDLVGFTVVVWGVNTFVNLKLHLKF
jgi:hypothetical protein